jgi:lipid-binding SYLF domain-containing protein
MNTMEGMIENGLKTLEEMKLLLPAAAFQHSFGLVLLESVQVGFIFSAGVGTGVILRHDKVAKKWSPPVAVGLSNVGAGVALGLERKHMVIFLTETQMMDAMASDFSLRLSLQSSVAVGPVGDEIDITAQIGNRGAGATSGYTQTRGLYVGVELEGAALAPRHKVNEDFYGRDIPVLKILFGTVEDMPACEPLDRLHAKLDELSKAPDHDPDHPTAKPFLANPPHTLDQKEELRGEPL